LPIEGRDEWLAAPDALLDQAALGDGVVDQRFDRAGDRGEGRPLSQLSLPSGRKGVLRGS